MDSYALKEERRKLLQQAKFIEMVIRLAAASTTKNGSLFKTIPKDFIVSLHPTVALHSENQRVTVNFTPGTFVFDLEQYKAAVINRQNMEIEKMSIPKSLSHLLVKTYLLHYGYEGTLGTFNLASDIAIPHEENICYALEDRKYLREVIMKGEIDDALAKLHDSYPEVIKDDKLEVDFPEVHFLLHCQKLIELVRTGSREEAKTHKETLTNLVNFTNSVLEEVYKDCNTLLQSEDPEESSVAYLLGEAQKEIVADAVNAAILSSISDQLQSRLERFVRQLATCCLKYEGEPFSFDSI